MSSNTLDDTTLNQILDRFIKFLSEEDGISTEIIKKIEELIKQGEIKDPNAILDKLNISEEDEK